uniref:Protein kinase domain-containing protein n=1 Tax=Ditylenchus dipsaci TaxID=166011 RepID=A0A915DW10_9BILA
MVDNPLNLFYYLRGFTGTPTDLNYLLHACGQTRVQSWEGFLPTKTCKKLGEGAYGEVFQSSINGVPVALKFRFICSRVEKSLRRRLCISDMPDGSTATESSEVPACRDSSVWFRSQPQVRAPLRT